MSVTSLPREDQPLTAPCRECQRGDAGVIRRRPDTAYLSSSTGSPAHDDGQLAAACCIARPGAAASWLCNADGSTVADMNDTDLGLYPMLASRVLTEGRTDPKDPSTTITATIETIDNDRPFGAAGGRSGMPMP